MYVIDHLKLAELRKRDKLKQEDVAVKVGKQAKHISHYEKGRAKPPGDVLLNYLILFNVAPREIAKKS